MQTSLPDEVSRVTVDCFTIDSPGKSFTMETEELTKLVDGIYKVSSTKFY